MFLLSGSDVWPPVHGIDSCFSVLRFYLMYFPNQSTDNDCLQGYSTGPELRGAAKPCTRPDICNLELHNASKFQILVLEY